MFIIKNTRIVLNNNKQKPDSVFKELRFRSTTSASALEHETNDESLAKNEWENAKPFEEIPTISAFKFFRSFLPGGRYANLDAINLMLAFKDDLGIVGRIPGIFGRKSSVITHNVEDFEKVLRNEGIWPNRPGSDALQYHRHVLRKDFFQGVEGLIGTQGETWSTFRSAVNPIMMQPKNVRLYLQKMSHVNKEFIERIREIRKPNTLEVPDTFDEEINRWTLESVSVVALDKQLGLITKNRSNPRATVLFEALNEFLECTFIVELQPSIWKYYKTPPFKKLMNALDKIVHVTSSYVNEAIERLDQESRNGVPEKPEHEKSVLEKLIKIDKKIATVMAMDMLMAGTDSTSSTFAGLMLCVAKNPEKQDKLRQEVLKILPEKNSEFTESSFKNMPYLRACVKEAERLYPLLVGNARIAGNDMVLSGYRVPRGTQVSMCSISFAGDSKHYPRPNEFLPERWLRPTKNCKENSDFSQELKSSNPFLHLPFGFGPRSCIGRRIAEMELELGLARMVRNFHIEFNYPTENAFKSLIINVPNIPLKFKFTDLD